MSWKDDYREDKEASGLTWDEFHDRRFIYAEDLNDLAAAITTLADHAEAIQREYQGLRRELNEVRTLMESEEFDA